MAAEKLFDDKAGEPRRRRAMRIAAPGSDFLMERVAADLGDRLDVVERQFEKAASLFSITPHAALVLRQSGKCGTVTRIEEPAFLEHPAFSSATGSPDQVPLAPQSLNLVVSLLSMHRFNDLPGFLVQVLRALKPDGLFLGAMPAAGTLHEMRESLLAAEAELTGGATPRIFPFADVRQLGALLQRAGFALPVTDIDTITVRYGSFPSLIADLRAMAATNTLAERARSYAGRKMFARAGEIYAERFSDPDGKLRATFEIAWISGWRPHESQQKPAKRGSATVSLADALKTRD